MTKDELKRRTRRFALDVIRLVDSLRRTRTADFVSKMGLVEEEADESMYWMELLVESGCVSAAGVEALLQEANELLAITVSSIKTARLAKDRTKYAIKRLRHPKSAIRNALVPRLWRPAAVCGGH